MGLGTGMELRLCPLVFPELLSSYRKSLPFCKWQQLLPHGKNVPENDTHQTKAGASVESEKQSPENTVLLDLGPVQSSDKGQQIAHCLVSFSWISETWCGRLSVHAYSVMSDFLQSCQAPPSMGFPRQEYWSGLPFPSPGHLLDPGMEPRSPASPALAAGFFPAEPPGKSGRLSNGLQRHPGPNLSNL